MADILAPRPCSDGAPDHAVEGVPRPASQSAGPRLCVRLAEGPEDLRAAQRLRWEIFYRERGSTGPCPERIDRDPFDEVCDHLLVEDCSEPLPRTVGTYRLLRRSVAVSAGGFYSATEFDLSPLDHLPGEWLELGRSCVAPAYRDAHTIQLLWRGIADYLQRYGISMMFGCASFEGIDPQRHAAALSHLWHQHLAPPQQRVRPIRSRHVEMERLPSGSYDVGKAVRSLPPLIRGYLRAGAVVGDGAVVDTDMRTIDVFVMLNVSGLAGRYADRFGMAG